MASITIRNIEDKLKERLRVQAAMHGRSMEEEARDILRTSLSHEPSPPIRLGSALHRLFEPAGDVDLFIPPREPIRTPPSFD